MIVWVGMVYREVIGEIKMSGVCVGVRWEKVKERKVVEIVVGEMMGMNVVENVLVGNRMYFVLGRIVRIGRKEVRKGGIVEVSEIGMDMSEER